MEFVSYKVSKDVSIMIDNIMTYKKVYHRLQSIIHPRNLKAALLSMQNLAVKDICIGEGLFTNLDYNTKTKNVIEVVNIYKSYDHVFQPLLDCTDHPTFLDVEYFILETHRKIMIGLHPDAGRLSTSTRLTTFNKSTFIYPQFMTAELAYQSLLTLTDKYNQIIRHLLTESDEHEMILTTFKCAAMLWNTLLGLHVFNDGNGRLARILTAYCLATVTPFVGSLTQFMHQEIFIGKTGLHNRTVCLQSEYIMCDYQSVNLTMAFLQQRPYELFETIVSSYCTMWKTFISLIIKDVDI